MVHPRILVVDDEAPMLNLLSSALGDAYTVETAANGHDALVRLRAEETFAVLVADLIMPGMSGIELLAECEKLSPLTVRIVLTGDPKRQAVIEAVNRGHIFQFIAKPVELELLRATIEMGVRRHEILAAEHDLCDTTLRTSINLLLDVLSTLDAQSFELSQRVRRSVRSYASMLRLPNAWELEMAAALARIGTATLPSGLLAKIGDAEAEITLREQELVDRVPLMGWQMLKGVPRLGRIAEAVRYQAKHFDGSGRPADAVAGEQIPLGGRILKVFMDRAALELEGVGKAAAHQQMAARAGVYDPAVLASSFQCFPDYILSGISATEQVRMLTAEDLQPGQVIVAEIRTDEGLVFVAAGTRLTPHLVQRIRNHVATGNLKEPFCVQPTAAEPGDEIATSGATAAVDSVSAPMAPPKNAGSP
jgi:response regulator RpfG family c-di-GMP phosphodiesterase